MIEKQSPLSMANLIVDIAIKNDKPISNLHLQKTLYFVQAFFLVKTGKPIIDGTFSRWPYGPIIKEVYYAFNKYGASEITEPVTIQDFPFEEIEIEEISTNVFSKYEDEVKQFVIKLINRTPWDLVEITHKQSIWANFEKEILKYEAPDYTNSEIEMEFKNNEEYQLWNL
ncbi:TPA: DUF4065 domain-containing protein [Streptococcus suis]|nr:DUF4065 domain-containing protein [Streptococcus suis]